MLELDDMLDGAVVRVDDDVMVVKNWSEDN